MNTSWSANNWDIVAVILAFIAIVVSGYTYWDSNYSFKLKSAVGKQVKLYVTKTDNSIIPVIFANISLFNNGGKTECLDDVKLVVEISTGQQKENIDFVTIREYTDIFNDSATITEILPIVVSAKSTTVKRYVFAKFPNIARYNAPHKFKIKCTLFVQFKGEWIKQKTYESNEISDVWEDLDSNIFKSKIIDIFEEK
ncbi:hypothetical protein B0A67_15285 [Flavobacterium aquidurense]|jgi:hypothetical protein|uniref:hypothetical protein n=1 Tax=Flavobacterium aquidurense TaxID=362413 RepID=UPI000923EC74|nr:hypothetical protein [Flavobacterium aquidurense]OXA70586.1 hypothetical protein B0A67_15285 [Flavobacterium aquidurense]SHG31088.1 hypothetical protein SAMN05444481_103326 [Flavobacterium frigidimaris]